MTTRPAGIKGEQEKVLRLTARVHGPRIGPCTLIACRLIGIRERDILRHEEGLEQTAAALPLVRQHLKLNLEELELQQLSGHKGKGGELWRGACEGDRSRPPRTY